MNKLKQRIQDLRDKSKSCQKDMHGSPCTTIYDMSIESLNMLCEEGIEEIENASSVNRWVSCDERLPEQSGIYLAYYTFKDGTHATDIAYLNAGHDLGSITHWMFLPEPPVVKQDE